MKRIATLALFVILWNSPFFSTAQQKTNFERVSSASSTMIRTVQIFPPQKCQVQWLSNPEELHFTSSDSHTLKACITCDSRAPLEEVQLYINGSTITTRGFNIVEEITAGEGTGQATDCSNLFSKEVDFKKNSLSLQKGDNKLYLEVTNKVGTTESEKLHWHYTPERRLALVIGNSNYNSLGKKLANPVNDAKAITKALHQLNFEVIAENNLTKTDFVDVITDFETKLKSYDVVLFYYAGHAIQATVSKEENGNYLLPIDVPDTLLEHESMVNFHTMPVNKILHAMGADNKNDRTNIVILDACRDDPFIAHTRSVSNKGLIGVDAPKNFCIAYATSPGKTADDGKGKHSPYTKQLLNFIHQPLELERMFKKVRSAVTEATKDKQIPWNASSLVNDFYLIKNEL